MLKKNRRKRTLKVIGEECYKFDFELEEMIYRYMCCKQKRKNKLDEKLKFESYHQWKQYVRGKYEKYEDYHLTEFSRYLNQNIRDKNNFAEYDKSVITVIITFAITEVMELLINANWILELLINIIMTIVLIFFIVFQTLNMRINDELPKYLLIDYKEIIDEIIKERR